MSRLEHVEQVELLKWVAQVAWCGFYVIDTNQPKPQRDTAAEPSLQLMFAIPNGGTRGDDARTRQIRGAMLKAEGVRSGVPDIFLPVPRKGYHGLFIELKRVKKGVKSANQKDWLAELNNQGYLAVTCYGAEETKNVIRSYYGVPTL